LKRWKIRLALGLLICFSTLISAQNLRWIYRYNGSGNSSDRANAMVYGSDNNIYAAGVINKTGSADDFAIVSIDTAGNEKWIYTYNGPDNTNDRCHAVTMGLDGKIYAAGVSHSSTGNDFTVVCLDTLGGDDWVYRYNGPSNASDEANAIVYGLDNNIYAAGYSVTLPNADIMIISLKPAGDTNWTFRYPGPGTGSEKAFSIVYGSDNNIYVVGNSTGSGTFYDFIIISLSTSGDTNWIYRRNGPGNGPDEGRSIDYGIDGYIYAAGYSLGSGTDNDFTIISLTHTATERWVLDYNGPGNDYDEGYSLVCDLDGNIYSAGYSTGSVSVEDFTVISLATGGGTRWIYRYNGPGNSDDRAYSLVYGDDGNVYAGGMSTGSGTNKDFTVASLTQDLGTENWVYRYDGPGNDSDGVYAIAYGDDDNIYCAGYSTGSATGGDFTVLSLETGVGIEEWQSKPLSKPLFSVASFFRENILLQFSEPSQMPLEIILYDVCGRCVYEKVFGSTSSSVEINDKNIKTLGSGVYFLSVISGRDKLGQVKLIKL
jgi:uncharacterized delta-60 repeat protein